MQIGQRVSHYRILERLGEGGMGVVYRAKNERLGTTVALKFLPHEATADPVAKLRFEQEARTASSLDHPNICTIHDIDETPDGQTFIVMACYEGETLKEKVARGPLPLAEAIDFVRQAANGLEKAHNAGIIHRDIKPANLIVTPDGLVKILDFGLAKVRDQTITPQGSALGTLLYMSPEQLRGESFDHRADIWALGVVLYELVSSRRPFDEAYPEAVLYNVLNIDPEPLNAVRPDTPVALSDAVGHALAKDPRDRFASAREMSERLRAIQGGDDSRAARRPGEGRRAGAWSIASAALTAAALALLLLMGPPETLGRQGLRYEVAPFSCTGIEEAACRTLPQTVAILLGQLRQRASTPVQVVSEPGVVHVNRRLRVDRSIRGSVTRQSGVSVLVLTFEDRRAGVDAVETETVRAGTLSDTWEGILHALAKHLGVRLSETDLIEILGAGTTDDALESYQRGRERLAGSDRKENVALAIRHFEDAVSEDSTFTLAHAGLCQAYQVLYDFEKDIRHYVRARAACDRALQLNGRYAQVACELGTLYLNTDSLAAARVEFLRALDIDPLCFDAKSGLAKLYHREGRADLAEETYREVIDLSPDTWTYRDDFAVFLHRQGRRDEAAQVWEDALERFPDNVRMLASLGATYSHMRRYEQAIPLFRRAIRLAPTVGAYNNLASTYYFLRDYRPAYAAYDSALTLDPRNFVVRGNLANVARELPEKREECNGLFQQALDGVDDDLRIDPGNQESARLRALYLWGLGRVPEARTLLDSLSAVVSNAETLRRMAVLYARMAAHDRAVATMERTLELNLKAEDYEQDFRAYPELSGLMQDPRYRRFWGG